MNNIPDNILKSFNDVGFLLKSVYYKNNRTPLIFVCNKGHEVVTCWNYWQQNPRCKKCSFDTRSKNKRLEYEFIKDSFNSVGYKLLTKNYKNAFSKLEYICNKDHRHITTWNAWSMGKRCPSCAGNIKLDLLFIKAAFYKEGYVILDDAYINSKTKLNYTCPKGHQHSITWSDWRAGYRCPYCNGRPVITIDFIKYKFNKDNYTLLSNKYKNNKSKLKYKCPNNHEHSIRWSDWLKGHRCPTCHILNNIGPNHPNWCGGDKEYCDAWRDKDYKEFIKLRDNYICRNPYCFKKDTKLNIHHINYNKKDCRPINLITICSNCNKRANKDREWHLEWYNIFNNNRGVK